MCFESYYRNGIHILGVFDRPVKLNNEIICKVIRNSAMIMCRDTCYAVIVNLYILAIPICVDNKVVHSVRHGKAE